MIIIVSLVSICYHTEWLHACCYSLMLYITSPWIYFITGSLYSLIAFPYITLSHLSQLWQPTDYSLYLWACFYFVMEIVHLFFFLGSTCKWTHKVFVFLYLTYFMYHSTVWIYPCCHKWKDLIHFYDWVIVDHL